MTPEEYRLKTKIKMAKRRKSLKENNLKRIEVVSYEECRKDIKAYVKQLTATFEKNRSHNIG